MQRDGIVVDELCATTDPAIFAIGDGTLPSRVGRSLRLESVQNAIDQAKHAAAAMVGKPKPYSEVPWFWSDQFDLKLQIAGLFNGYDHIVFRGVISDRAFAVFYYQGEKLIAVDAVNKPADHMIGRRLVTVGTRLSAAEIADLSFDLKQAAADPARG